MSEKIKDIQQEIDELLEKTDDEDLISGEEYQRPNVTEEETETKVDAENNLDVSNKKPKNNLFYENNYKNVELLLDIKLNLSVEIGRAKRKIEDVLRMGKGTIVELEKLNGDPVDIMVNDCLIAQGVVVALDENFGIKIINIIDVEERFKRAL